MVSLSEAVLVKGRKYRVVKIDAVDSHTHRLMDLGLVVGAVFELSKRAPFGDPIELELRGSSMCVRSQEARHVFIEEME